MSNIHQRKTCFSLMDMKSEFIGAAIHSAVRVSTGEADEIAVQSFCGFCVKMGPSRRFGY
jgi:hypothetical protein